MFASSASLQIKAPESAPRWVLHRETNGSQDIESCAPQYAVRPHLDSCAESAGFCAVFLAGPAPSVLPAGSQQWLERVRRCTKQWGICSRQAVCYHASAASQCIAVCKSLRGWHTCNRAGLTFYFIGNRPRTRPTRIQLLHARGTRPPLILNKQGLCVGCRVGLQAPGAGAKPSTMQLNMFPVPLTPETHQFFEMKAKEAADPKARNQECAKPAAMTPTHPESRRELTS